jgi:hypothetical protein
LVIEYVCCWRADVAADKESSSGAHATDFALALDQDGAELHTYILG